MNYGDSTVLSDGDYTAATNQRIQDSTWNKGLYEIWGDGHIDNCPILGNFPYEPCYWINSHKVCAVVVIEPDTVVSETGELS